MAKGRTVDSPLDLQPGGRHQHRQSLSATKILGQFLGRALLKIKILRQRSDKVLMSKNIFPWVKPLGLSSSNFADKPEGANSLVWGLKNNIINPEEYLQWATEYFQLPAIKAEFFSFALDFNLIEKYSNLYDWHAYCYPIYQWENQLFIACLEPPTTSISMNTCFVIAPFHALESAWQKNENSRPGAPKATEQVPIIETPAAIESEPSLAATEVATVDTPPPPPAPSIETSSVERVNEKSPEAEVPQSPPIEAVGLDFGDLKMEMGVEDIDQPESEPKDVKKTDHEVGDLDFSTMEQSFPDSTEDTPEGAAEAEADPIPQDEVVAEEITHTKVDEGLGNLTSATQTMHASQYTAASAEPASENPPLPFDNLTIDGISLEGEQTQIDEPELEKTKVDPTAEQHKVAAANSNKVITPPPPTPMAAPSPAVAQSEDKKFNDENSIPSLDDLKQHQTENPQQAPGLEEENPDFDDDYTPVPVLTKAQQEAQQRRKQEALAKEQKVEKSRISENTITDHSQPILIPAENLISDSEIKEASNMDNASSIKHVIAHIFGHLRRDYAKLMWLELDKDDRYFSQYVFGDWKITELAWKMHVNITNPNMFRVAFKSGHPFHGVISSNPYNEKYFEWWCRGKTPDFATIYPVTINETIIGFVAAFGKGSEFDEVGSLKKVENLITICKKSLAKFTSAKAA